MKQVIEHLDGSDIDVILDSRNRRLSRLLRPWKEAFFIMRTLWGFYPTSKPTTLIAQEIINFPDIEMLEKFIAHGVNMQIKTKNSLIAILFRSNKVEKYLACLRYARNIVNDLPPIRVMSKINVLGDGIARCVSKYDSEDSVSSERTTITVVNITDKELNQILS